MRPAFLVLLLAACGGSDPPVLRGDTNHDGVLSEADDDARGQAIFLANLDDDDGDGVRDENDAHVNGDADLADMAPLQVTAWPDAPDDSTGELRLAAPKGLVRVFVKRSGWHPASLPLALGADELRGGVDLAVEGRTFMGTPEAGDWDGTVQLSLQVDGKASGTVTLRVAPLLFQYNTAAPSVIYYSGGQDFNEPFAEGIHAALPGGPPVTGLTIPGDAQQGWDQWTQDFFDVAHTSRPGPHGVPVDMKIAVRSAQDWRPAGDVVRSLLAPDMGWIFVHGAGRNSLSDSMNSFGNWDVIPPHAGWPLGRNIWGARDDDPDLRPDDVFSSFVSAQGPQGSFTLDTSWLVVGHVDEIVSMVAAPGGGFRLFAAAPELARQMLLDLSSQGHGDAVVFEGRTDVVYDQQGQPLYRPADITVDELLSDDEIMADSQEAQNLIDPEVQKLAAEAGVPMSEVVPFPFLFYALGGSYTAYQPGTVNLLPVGTTLIMPAPFGPRVNGDDVFARDLTDRLSMLGYTPKFVDDWDVYHVNFGEVHCGTNAMRGIDVRFWEAR